MLCAIACNTLETRTMLRGYFGPQKTYLAPPPSPQTPSWSLCASPSTPLQIKHPPPNFNANRPPQPLGHLPLPPPPNQKKIFKNIRNIHQKSDSMSSSSSRSKSRSSSGLSGMRRRSRSSSGMSSGSRSGRGGSGGGSSGMSGMRRTSRSSRGMSSSSRSGKSSAGGRKTWATEILEGKALRSRKMLRYEHVV